MTVGMLLESILKGVLHHGSNRKCDPFDGTNYEDIADKLAAWNGSTWRRNYVRPASGAPDDTAERHRCDISTSAYRER
jgi:hypothetical protein